MFEGYAQKGIIDAADLAPLVEGGLVKLLDASFALPSSSINPHQEFYQKRIGAAQFFDITQIANPASELPNMLPTAESFSSAVAQLGISNDDRIVIYGQNGIIMGPARAWWMFRAMGHKNVCVLNGGLPAWEKAGLPLNTVPPTKPDIHGRYETAFRAELVCDKAGVSAALGHALILDARAEGRFSGAQSEPRAGLRSGHIPGSVNVPATSLIEPKTGCLKSADALREILNQPNALSGHNKTIITTCGSGVTACVITLALHNLGITDAAVYDGSWSEWGRDDSGCYIAGDAV